ncbi:hypothetical protein UlMin_043996 [Ulmus minor]
MEALNKPLQTHLLLLLVLTLSTFLRPSSAGTDEDTLIEFKSYLLNDTALGDWDASVRVCTNRSTWTGVTCLKDKFYGLKLENMGLMGLIHVDTLAKLPTLRSLSFMNNSFEGPMPEVKKLGRLKVLYLSYNKFSGEIEGDAFEGMSNLKKVYLARNDFWGDAPRSLLGLSKLVELDLQGNQFQGRLLELQHRGWTWRFFNVSYNRFVGRIPVSLSMIDSTAFIGNNLCGRPLGDCKSNNKSIIIIATVVTIATVIAIIALIFFVRAYRARKSKSKSGRETKAYKKFGPAQSPDGDGNYKRGENGTLHFVRDDRERFELEDLLRASAEVLGSGSFGSSYKAVLFSGAAMVVKRFRHMNNVRREEFHAHMARLGRLSHPNVLPPIGYYYTKEEKLLISDFVENGSLASHLHARRTAGEPGLDWPTRLNIIKGVARGLAYLYKELTNLTLPHGHLKSSNILLDRNFKPYLTEFALVPIINRDHAQQFMAAFKSPEFSLRDRTTRKTDVWSLGILILELLTGKFPANYLKPGKKSSADLAAWVNSVVREEWTGEVFDKEMRRTKNGEGEMLKLLKIGMCCCEGGAEERWDWKEAVERIEELKERDEEDEYSSYATDWDVNSSRGLTDEDFSFSVVNG